MKIFNVQNIYVGYKYFEPDKEFTEQRMITQWFPDETASYKEM